MGGNLTVEGGPGAGSGSGGPLEVSTADIAGLAANTLGTLTAAGGVGLALAQLAKDSELSVASVLDPAGAAHVAAAIAAAGLGSDGIAAALGRLSAHLAHLTEAAAAYENTETLVAGLAARVNTRLLHDGRVGLLVTTARNAAAEITDVFEDMAAGKPVNGSLKKHGLEFLEKETEPLITQLGDALGTVARAGGVVALGLNALGVSTKGYPLQTLQGGTQGVSALLAWATGGTSLGTTGMKLQVTPHPSTTRVAAGGLNGIAANGLDTVVGKDAVAVTAVHNPGRPDRYILSVPGTTEWFDNRHPLDWNSNVQEESGIPSDTRRLAQAAARAGIPPGAEVMVVGYSQGGIVAANLAADPAFRRQYRVRGLMTVASPTGRILPRLGPETNSLAVEHRNDVVTGVDGARPVPGRNRWVARGDTPAGAKSFHDYTTGYRRDLDTLAASTDPDAVSYRRAVQQFMGQAGGTVTVTRFDGRRVRK